MRRCSDKALATTTRQSIRSRSSRVDSCFRPTAQAFRALESRLRQSAAVQVANQPEVTERDVAAGPGGLPGCGLLPAGRRRPGGEVDCPLGEPSTWQPEAEEIVESFPIAP